MDPVLERSKAIKEKLLELDGVVAVVHTPEECSSEDFFHRIVLLFSTVETKEQAMPAIEQIVKNEVGRIVAPKRLPGYILAELERAQREK